MHPGELAHLRAETNRWALPLAPPAVPLVDSSPLQLHQVEARGLAAIGARRSWDPLAFQNDPSETALASRAVTQTHRRFTTTSTHHRSLPLSLSTKPHSAVVLPLHPWLSTNAGRTERSCIKTFYCQKGALNHCDLSTTSMS